MTDRTEKRRPRLLLHAGLHKTGTTALQEFASTNRVLMREHGLWYPDYQPVRAESWNSHNRLAHSLAATGKSGNLSREEIGRLVSGWKNNAGGDTVLVSAEALSRHVVAMPDGDWVAQRLRFLEQVAHTFSGFAIEVVLVLRRQDRFVHSAYLENIMKATRTAALPFPQFREEFERRSLRYEDNLDAFERAFGTVHVMVYEDLLRDGRMCRNFFEALGFPVGDLAEPGPVRSSLTVSQARVKRFLRPIVFSRRMNRGVNAMVRSTPATFMARHLVPESAYGFWESETARRQWQRRYDRENERIRHRFLPQRTELFPAP